MSEIVIDPHHLNMVNEEIVGENSLHNFFRIVLAPPRCGGSWAAVILESHCRNHQHERAERVSVGADNAWFAVLMGTKT